MKYMFSVIESPSGVLETITTTVDDANFVQFPATIGNPNYDAFLVQVDLTDEEVHALPVDEWIEA